MATILWIIAVVLVFAGIVQLFQGQVLLGIVLIVVGFLVGPGGVSIFAATTSLGLVGLWPPARMTVTAPRPKWHSPAQTGTQQVTAEVAHQLGQPVEDHREDAGQ